MVNYGHFFNFLKMVQKQRQTAIESFSTIPNVILGLFCRFKEVEKMAKNGQKVKANPLPFWSILATFSTF